MDGLHILAEFHRCRCEAALLQEGQRLRHLCLASCREAGLSVVGHVFHEFGTAQRPSGATGAVVLAESHMTVHTWPELGAATIDIYVCNFSQDNRAAAEAAYRGLLAAFRPEHATRRDVQRGGSPSALA